jgi:hypothetical protein
MICSWRRSSSTSSDKEFGSGPELEEVEEAGSADFAFAASGVDETRWRGKTKSPE